jgi:hypothetical protein
VQLVVSLFLTLVLVGILSLPLWVLFATLYAILLGANFLRYKLSKAVVRRVFLFVGTDVPKDATATIRIEFAKATFLQCLSMVVAIFFALKIVVGSYPWLSNMNINHDKSLASIVAENAVAQVVVFILGAVSSFFAKIGINSISPQGG